MKNKKYYLSFLIIGFAFFNFLFLNILKTNLIFNEEKKIKSFAIPKNDFLINDFETGLDYGGLVTNDSEGYNVLYTWGNNKFNSLGRTTEKTYDEFPGIVEFNDETGRQMEHNEYIIKNLFFTDSTSYAVLNYDGIDHLYGWGKNDNNQVGLGSNNEIKIPTLFDELNMIGSILYDGGEIIDIVGFETMTTINIKNSDGSYSLLSVGLDFENKGLYGEVDINSSSEWTEVFTKQENGDKITSVTLTPFSASVIVEKDPNNVEIGSLETELWVWGFEGGNNIGTLLPGTTNGPGVIEPKNIASTIYFPELENQNARIKKYVSNAWTSIAIISPGNDQSDIIRISGNSFAGTFNNETCYFSENNISSKFEALEPSKKSSIENINIVNNINGSTNPEKYGKPSLIMSVIDGESGKNLIYTWGKNTNGLFGSGETNEDLIIGEKSDDIPNEISSNFPYYNESTRFIDVGITETFGYAFASTDGINYSYTWGENNVGQFGNGTTNSSISPTPQLTIPEATFEIEYSDITINSLKINFKVYFNEENVANSFDSFDITGTGINNIDKNYVITYDQLSITEIETGKFGYTGSIQVNDLNTSTIYNDWFLTLNWTSSVSFLEKQISSYRIEEISTAKKIPIVNNVNVLNINDESVKINWDLIDENSAITSMFINHPNVGEGSSDILGLNEIVINGLNSNTTYSNWTLDYKYDLNNGFGEQSESITIEEFTMLKKMPSISNIRITNLTQNLVKINWDLIDPDNAITSMFINHPNVGEGSSDILGLNEIVINGLNSNTTYSNWTISGTYDLNNGEESFEKNLNEIEFRTDYKINKIEKIENNEKEINIFLNIDGSIDYFNEQELKVKVEIENESGEKYIIESFIDKNTKSITIDNSDKIFKDKNGYNLTKISYNHDFIFYKYKIDSNYFFIMDYNQNKNNLWWIILIFLICSIILTIFILITIKNVENTKKLQERK